MPPQAVQHYENFPVASWLCPAKWRPAVAALYHYARTADDLADEGDHNPTHRLQCLEAYRQDVHRAQAELPLQSPWRNTIAAVAEQANRYQLDWHELLLLLDAFEQDVRFTASGETYRNMDDLLTYCRRSANPIGRLMLQIMGQATPPNIAASDHICTALQLINFWQDLSVDLPRHRHYVPDSVWDAHHLPPRTDMRHIPESAAQRVVAELVEHARECMQQGAWLPTVIPGRMGWELRAVVMGGLRVTERIRTLGYRSWLKRPTVTRADGARIILRCLAYPYGR